MSEGCCSDLSEGQTGQTEPSMVGIVRRQSSSSPERNMWRRKAAVCAMAFVLALMAASFSDQTKESELSSLDPLSERAIHQREEELAEKLYSAEAEEAKVL